MGSLALGDIDADGDLDLVVANITSTFQASGNLLYLNDGSGSFHDVTGTRWQDDSLGTQCVALADLDGDSDPEILACGIHWNLHRHVLARTEPVLGRRFVIEMIAEPGYGSSLLVALPALATSLAPTAVPTPFGNLFLAPAAGVTLPFGSLPQPAGRTAVVLGVPPSPGLLGLNLFVQALVIDVIAGGGRLTNYVWDRVR